jgi:copper chaperone CopZ
VLPSDAPTPDPVPHDFIDAEFSVAGLNGPADEQTLSAALNALDGIESRSISGGKVAIEYDPVQITKAQLTAAITNAGFRVGDVESGPASSIGDALRKDNP